MIFNQIIISTTFYLHICSNLSKRKTVRPAKDAIHRISRLDSELIQEQTLPFLKDLMEQILNIFQNLNTSTVISFSGQS